MILLKMSPPQIDSEIRMSNIDCIATMLRYPELMFSYNGGIPLDRQMDNIRSTVSLLGASDYKSRILTVGSDVQHDILNPDLPFLGVSTRSGNITNRNRVPGGPAGLGPRDMDGIAKMLNKCYNEEQYGNNSLPPFIVVRCTGLPNTDLLEFRFDDNNSGGELDWDAYRINFKVPGYICVGDIIQNSVHRTTINKDADRWAERNIPKYTPLLLFARQEICLVGTGTAVTTNMGRQWSATERVLYMHPDNNSYYRPMGVFTTPANNVAVLKCAFVEAPMYLKLLLSGDEGSHSIMQLTDFLMNGNFMKAPYSSSYSTGLKTMKYFKDIMHRFIENGLTHMKRLRKAPDNYPFGWYSFIDSFPNDNNGGVNDVKAFFTALCNDDAKIAGRTTLCDCIKPLDQRTKAEQQAQIDARAYKSTLDIFRETLGLKDRPDQVISFACNTKACVDSDPNKTMRFEDPCPTTNPRLCFPAIKLDKPADILANVCYNCTDTILQCETQVPVISETPDSELLQCGVNPDDGTKIYCATSDAVKQYVNNITLAATAAALAAAEAESAKNAALASTATVASAKIASDAAAAAAATAAEAAATATTAWGNAKTQTLTLEGVEKEEADAFIENGTFKESAARTSADAAAASALAALAAYTALVAKTPTTPTGPATPPSTVIGVAAVQFYTTRITALKSEVAEATLEIESEKAKATAPTATLTIALSAKNISSLTIVRATNGALASGDAMSGANAEKIKLTAAADITAAAAIFATAIEEHQAIQISAGKATAAMFRINSAYEELLAAYNASDAIPTQTIKAQINRVALAKIKATEAAASALRAKNSALAATTQAAADAAVILATDAAESAADALAEAKNAQTIALDTHQSMQGGEAKESAAADNANIAIEIRAIQELAASAENLKSAAQAAALAFSEGMTIPGETTPEETPGEAMPEEDAGKLNVGMIAGITVGVVVALVIIVVVVFVSRKRMNNNKKK